MRTIAHTDYLDLRDVADVLNDPGACDEGEAAFAKGVKRAIEQDIGADFEDYARNEPTAIREDAFTEYAQQLAEDVGAIDRDADWPLYHIDWEAAADTLKMDYTSFDVDGITYLIRAY